MVTIKNVLLWLEGRHGDACATVQWHRQQRSVPLQTTHQSDAGSKHSHPVLLRIRLVAEFCPRFCIVNWIEVRTVRQPQIWKVLRVNTIS